MKLSKERITKIIEEEVVRLTEMNDNQFVIDQLVNNVEDGTLTRSDFIEYLNYETNFDKKKLGKIYDVYLKLDGRSRVKLDKPSYAKKFLQKI